MKIKKSKEAFDNSVEYSMLTYKGNKFGSNIWRLKDKNLKFDIFTEQMRIPIKLYLLEKSKTVSDRTLTRKFNGIRFWGKFLNKNLPTINNFEQLNIIIIKTYFSYILDYEYVRKNVNGSVEKRKFSKSSIVHSSFWLKDLYYMANRKNWFKVENSLLDNIDRVYFEMISNNPRVKSVKKKTTKKEYSLKTIKRILSCAYKDDDLYLKTQVFLQSQCGLRIEEVLSIKEDCLINIAGNIKIRYETSKTKLGIIEVEKPINAVAAELVKELTNFTKDIRKQLKTNKIFVKRSNKFYGIARNENYKKTTTTGKPIKFKLGVIKKHNFNKRHIRPFVERWDIKEDGKRINLSTHYFRHFFAHLAWLNSMSIQSIKEMLNHESYAMTDTYMYNAEKIMRNKFKKMMSNPTSIIGNNLGDYKDKLSKKNIFKGKTEKQLDAIIDVMNIQILANGACMHHPLKAKERLKKCKPGCIKCDKFITHKCYLDVHQKRVERIDVILKDALSKNRSFWYEKNLKEKEYIINNFIKPFIK